MKEFNLELAKAGRPVQTRDGRAVRILCYDLISTSGCTIGALINNGTYEGWTTYSEDGKAFPEDGNTNSDLVMSLTKKRGLD